jgi:hypothetical protein
MVSKLFEAARSVSAAFRTPLRRIRSPCASGARAAWECVRCSGAWGAFIASGDPDQENFERNTYSVLSKYLSFVPRTGESWPVPARPRDASSDDLKVHDFSIARWKFRVLCSIGPTLPCNFRPVPDCPGLSRRTSRVSISVDIGSGRASELRPFGVQ